MTTIRKPLTAVLAPASEGPARELRRQLEADPVPELELLLAENLGAALRLAEERTADLLLLSVPTDELVILAALDRIRAAAPALATILLADSADDALTCACLRAGAENLLVPSAPAAPSLRQCLARAAARSYAQATIKSSEARFRSIFENALEGIYQTTPSGALLDANPALIRMLGYESKEELCSISMEELYLESGGRDEWMRLAEREGQIRDSEIVLRRKDGSLLAALESSRVIRSPAGEILFFEGMITDITARKQHENRLAFLAEHDPMTGLLNRRSLIERLESEMAGAAISSGALLWLDLDCFKRINDSLGHATGDELLASISGLLRKRVREGDVVSRFGGDEFVVLLPGADRDGAISVADKLLQAIRGHAPKMGCPPPRVTASIGIAVYGSTPLDPDELLARADRAMYHSKEEGGDRWTMSNDRSLAAPQAPTEWAESCRRNLEACATPLLAEPVLDLLSDSVSRYTLSYSRERLDDLKSQVGLLRSERESLARQVELAFAGHALRLVSGLAPSLRFDLPVSAATLASGALRARVEELLQRYPMDARRLTWSVSDLYELDDLERAHEEAVALAAYGFGITCGSFGLSSSAFGLLHGFPADTFEIEESYCRSLLTNRLNQTVLQAVVLLCRGLGKKIQAPAVEDGVDVEILRQYGVHLARGTAIGAPRLLEEVLAENHPRICSPAASSVGLGRLDPCAATAAQISHHRSS